MKKNEPSMEHKKHKIKIAASTGIESCDEEMISVSGIEQSNWRREMNPTEWESSSPSRESVLVELRFLVTRIVTRF
jgi:hypothetical protein